MHDMVIRCDGTGADPVMANIATDGDRITVVGTLDAGEYRRRARAS